MDTAGWADGVRPYGFQNPNDSVKVIGHDDKFILKDLNFLAYFA
jgi:hypothetical protein